MKENFIKTMMLVDNLSAQLNFVKENPDLTASEISLVFKYLSPELSLKHLKSTERDMAIALAKMPACPQEILTYFANHSLKTVKSAALSSPMLCPIFVEKAFKACLQSLNEDSVFTLRCLISCQPISDPLWESLVSYLHLAPMEEVLKQKKSYKDICKEIRVTNHHYYNTLKKLAKTKTLTIESF